jgi:hypothetical protein
VILRKIERVERAPFPCGVAPHGNGPLYLFLEGGERIETAGSHVGYLVPLPGDWWTDDGKIFQHYRVVKGKTGILHLSDGSPMPIGHPHDVAAKEGDYYIRRTDGYRLVERFRFERENASALEAFSREQRAVGA